MTRTPLLASMCFSALVGVAFATNQREAVPVPVGPKPDCDTQELHDKPISPVPLFESDGENCVSLKVKNLSPSGTNSLIRITTTWSNGQQTESIYADGQGGRKECYITSLTAQEMEAPQSTVELCRLP